MGPPGKTETMCAFVQSLQNLERQKKKKEGRKDHDCICNKFRFSSHGCNHVVRFVCLSFFFFFFGFPFLLFDVGSSLLWLRNNVLSLLKKDN